MQQSDLQQSDLQQSDLTCSKIPYYSKKSAMKALHQQQKWDTRVQRVYFCTECHCFHLTSSKKSYIKKKRKTKRNIKSREEKKSSQQIKIDLKRQCEIFSRS